MELDASPGFRMKELFFHGCCYKKSFLQHMEIFLQMQEYL